MGKRDFAGAFKRLVGAALVAGGAFLALQDRIVLPHKPHGAPHAYEGTALLLLAMSAVAFGLAVLLSKEPLAGRSLRAHAPTIALIACGAGLLVAAMARSVPL